MLTAPYGSSGPGVERLQLSKFLCLTLEPLGRDPLEQLEVPLDSV